MYGTSSLISAGVTSRAESTPHDFADAIRRRSSSIRSSVRATSMPPHSVLTPISTYWRCDSSVSWVISFEWSTGKMKFEACPVEPPGFGKRPLVDLDDVGPAEPGEVVGEAVADDAAADHDGPGARWEGAHEVTAPVLVVRGHGQRTARIARSKPSMWRRMTLSARGRVAVADRLEQLAVLGDGVVEPGDAVEGEEPDAQRQRVVLVQGRLDERVVRAAVDVPVDPLVELDQRPLVAAVGDARQLGEERTGDLAVVRARALGREAGREALEHDPGLGERGEVADVDRRDDDAAPGIDLDELLLRERPQRLAHRRAPEPEPLHQLALADRRARAAARA